MKIEEINNSLIMNEHSKKKCLNMSKNNIEELITLGNTGLSFNPSQSNPEYYVVIIKV